MKNNREFYTTQLLIYSVIPLFKEVAIKTKLGKALLKQNGVIQFSVIHNGEKEGIRFLVYEKEIKTIIGTVKMPDVELEFKTRKHFNSFFKGESKKLPKIKGLKKPILLTSAIAVLLKMSSILTVKEAPKKESEKELLTTMMFYLLTSGISRLNKLNYPEIKDWTIKSPDRVYALEVRDTNAAAYIRIKAGKSKSSRGIYKRSKPFFTMKFADFDSALSILQERGDLLDLTAKGKLIMEGAPEFGAKLGEFMLLVGTFVQ